MQSSLFVRAKLVLTRTKLATRGTANSKEHEVQVTATRRGGRVGRACGTAGPRTSPSDTRENFLPESRTNTNPKAPSKAAGRPVGSACGFLSPSDAGQVRLEPTANGSRLLETSLNRRHFVGAHPYRMRLHTQGGFRPGVARAKPAVWRSACQRVLPERVEEPNIAPRPRYALLTARFDSPCTLAPLRTLVKHSYSHHS